MKHAVLELIAAQLAVFCFVFAEIVDFVWNFCFQQFCVGFYFRGYVIL